MSMEIPSTKENKNKEMQDEKGDAMAVNQRVIKVLNRIFEAGFTDEKAISAMTMDDILSLQGVSVADIAVINELQKAIKSGKVLSYLSGSTAEPLL